MLFRKVHGLGAVILMTARPEIGLQIIFLAVDSVHFAQKASSFLNIDNAAMSVQPVFGSVFVEHGTRNNQPGDIAELHGLKEIRHEIARAHMVIEHSALEFVQIAAGMIRSSSAVV